MSRKCAAPDCQTILSIYNPATRCWLHTDRKPVKGDGIHMGRKRERTEDLTDVEVRRYREGRW